jgi:hypothetical protein
MKRICCLLRRTWILAVLIGFAAASVYAESSPGFKITGAVENELVLTLKDLQRFQTTECQRNDVTSDNKFNGVFWFKGVCLRTLLKTAKIVKKDKDFQKQVDMAILVKNPQTQVALSWGEVFYRNPGSVFIAWTGQAILPHKSCQSCHPPEMYEPVMDRCNRSVSFPRLVITEDQYADRCLEGVTEIKIVELDWKGKTKPQEPLYSSEFCITGPDLEKTVFDDLADKGISSLGADLFTVGEGKGFHGTPSYTGFSFIELLTLAGVKPDLTTVFRVSAPDNYRSVFSWGEIFLNPAGRRMLLANQESGSAIEDGGRYFLIVPNDLMADRWIKSVQAIEKIELK